MPPRKAKPKPKRSRMYRAMHAPGSVGSALSSKAVEVISKLDATRIALIVSLLIGGGSGVNTLVNRAKVDDSQAQVDTLKTQRRAQWESVRAERARMKVQLDSLRADVLRLKGRVRQLERRR